MSFWGTTLNSLPSWLGGPKTYGPSTPTSADVPPLQGQHYPNPSDVQFARDNDATYGDSSAAFAQAPYGGQIPTMTTKPQVANVFNGMLDGSIKDVPVKPGSVTPRTSDNMMAAYLATRRSALAALGFDPRRMAIGDASTGDWSINGGYFPDVDRVVSTGEYPSTTTHESMHRGMEMLRQAGVMPKDGYGMSEENLVRAQMLKNFGGIERGRGPSADELVKRGQAYNDSEQLSPVMDAIEAAAQQLYAKRHPGGPR